jgi:hypothetical protein
MSWSLRLLRQPAHGRADPRRRHPARDLAAHGRLLAQSHPRRSPCLGQLPLRQRPRRHRDPPAHPPAHHRRRPLPPRRPRLDRRITRPQHRTPPAPCTCSRHHQPNCSASQPPTRSQIAAVRKQREHPLCAHTIGYERSNFSGYSPRVTLSPHAIATAHVADQHKQCQPAVWHTAPYLSASGWQKEPLTWCFTGGRCCVRTNVG